MGRVVSPFGVKGWIKVAPFTETPASLCGYPRWWLGGADTWREVEVLEATVHGVTVLARLAGCDGRDAALALKGAEIAVPRDALPVPGEDEHYWADLVGLKVVNVRGEALGELAEMFSNGAHDIMRVRQDGMERLVPFVGHVVREVSLADRRILVEWEADW